MNIFESLVSRYRIKPKTNIETVKLEDAEEDGTSVEPLEISVESATLQIKREEERVSTSDMEISESRKGNEDNGIIQLDSDSDTGIIFLEDLTVIDDTGIVLGSPARKKCRRNTASASRSAHASFLDGSFTVVDETFASTPGTSAIKKKKRRHSSAPLINSPLPPPTTTEMFKAIAQGALFPKNPKEIDLLTKMTRINHQKIARHWEYLQKLTSGLKRKSTTLQDIRICTYNVLCQKTTERTGYLYKHLRKNNDEAALQWDRRWSLLSDELNTLDADVFCLQEVQHDHYEQYFKPHLERLGYRCFYKRKTGDEYFDGCAFFFRSSKFELVSKRDLEYFVSKETVMDRPQIAQIFRLRCLKTKKQLVLANTHLIFNNTRGDVKFGQAMMLMANVHKELKENGDCPVIIMGDFNIETDSFVWKYFQHSKADLRGIPRNELSGQGKKGGPVIDPSLILPPSLMIGSDSVLHDEVEILETAEQVVVDKYAISHPLALTSVYSDVRPAPNKTPISTFHSDFGNPDFIFYSVKEKKYSTASLTESVFEHSSLRLLRRLSLPTLQMVQETVGPWPNKYIPSDHIPLVADFLICP